MNEEPIYTVIREWRRCVDGTYYTIMEREPAIGHQCSPFCITVTATVNAQTPKGVVPMQRMDTFDLDGETVDEAFEGLPELVQGFGALIRERIIADARRPVAARFDGR
jgi:hypothetical protein